MHEFLAREGWAPTLRHYGPFRETAGLSDIIPAHVQNALPGLDLQSDVMRMVVVDYIDAQPNPPPDARGQIERVLTLLHANGYVIGDLRERNILFDTDDKAKFIDFDWCGRYDMKIRDEGLADERQKQIENMDCVLVVDGPYAHYPLSMSTIGGMWAPGMEAHKQIRPKHDWMMFDMLQW